MVDGNFVFSYFIPNSKNKKKERISNVFFFLKKNRKQKITAYQVQPKLIVSTGVMEHFMKLGLS